MKFAFRAAGIVGLLAIFLPLPAHAAVQETLKTDYYPVTVNTGSLNDAMTRAFKWKKGDATPGAQSYTNMNIKWIYHLSNAGNGFCQISSVTTQLIMTMGMPRLVSSPHYQGEFDARLAKLQKYEDGRVKIGREMAQEIDHTLTSMEKDYCTVISMNANNRAHNIARNLIAKSREYDKVTKH